MTVLVFYKSSKGDEGNLQMDWPIYPPTNKNIRDAETYIKENVCEDADVCITNWKRISSEDDVKSSKFEDIMNITINNQDIHVGDKIDIIDELGSCVYNVGFGQYLVDNKTHIGWYLALFMSDAKYLLDRRIMIRPLGDLLSAESNDIKEFKINPELNDVQIVEELSNNSD